jgi:hypothetical protein
MLSRRRILAGITTGVIGLGGCAATQQEFSFAANPARFDETLLSETGYTLQNREEIVQTRTVTAGGQEREVTTTNYLTTYRRIATVQQTEYELVAAIFSSPSVSIIGQEFNPLGEMDLPDVLRQSQSQFGDAVGRNTKLGERVDTQSIQILGTETTLGIFSGTTSIAGREAELRLPLTKLKDSGDFIILRGGYLMRIADTELSRILSLFKGTEH